MNSIDLARLQQALTYDAETGRLVWKQSRANYVGREAGTIDFEGYRCIKIGGLRIRAHRIAWALHFGYWPEMPIDHVNGDRADNRLANLRLCSLSQNQGNRRKMKAGSSQFKGVVRERDGRWRAKVARRKIGSFATEAEAAEAYRAAATQFWGDFANPAKFEGAV